MRTPIYITAGTAVLTLGLTGCGESQEDEALRGMLDCPEDRSIEDCQEDQRAEIDESMEDWDEDPMTEDSGDQQAQMGLPDEEFSFGQTAAYRDPDTGQELGVFTVEYVDKAYDCNGAPAVAAEITVNTVGQDTPVALSPEDFIFMMDETGLTQGAAASGCEATLEVPADSEGSELLVFDVEQAEGAIALDNEHSSAFWTM